MSGYSDDEMLMLSGIQHFVFCRRQWVLIHLYGQWRENVLTIEGQWLHRNADNVSETRFRDGVAQICRVSVASSRLGLMGFCDIVELTACGLSDGGIRWKGIDGLYKISPIEYKHGVEKIGDEDRLQLCAQAMCLEESNNVRVESGAIYYGKLRRRSVVEFSEELRRRTEDVAVEMHKIYDSAKNEKVEYSKKCGGCSLYEICRPREESEKRSAAKYLKILAEDETTS